MEEPTIVTPRTAELVGLNHYSPAQPLLLWTDFPPSFQGGGAVIVRSLISAEDRKRILWISPSLSERDSERSTLGLKTGGFGKRHRRSLGLDLTILSHRMATETLALAQAHQARAIWIVLHGAGVPVAAHLVRTRQLPTHVTVHDDPAFGVALRSRRYLALVPWIARSLALAVEGAASVDVISEAMSKRYQERYRAPSIVVHRAVPGPVVASPPFNGAVNGLRVGVLGNTYRYEPLRRLGAAVEQASRELGISGRITVIGSGRAAQLQRDCGERIKVDAVGHLAEEEAVALLRSCFLVYLNYPFGARDAVLRTTSFPTKLSTYVLAARPILVHSPADSTVASLGGRNGYVYYWSSMDPSEGCRVLVSAWREKGSHASAHEPAEGIRKQFFEPFDNRARMLLALNSLVRPLAGTGEPSRLESSLT